MGTTGKYICPAILLLLCLLSFSCTPGGVRLSAQGVSAVEPTGTYTAILYGCNFTDDPYSVAFLDKEGDAYAMEPYAPPYNYRIATGVGAKDAFTMAEGFLHCSTALQSYLLKEVVVPGGGIIGYEIRPLYYPFVYGAGDMLSVDYWLNDGRVMIHIRLEPWADHLFFGGSSSIEN